MVIYKHNLIKPGTGDYRYWQYGDQVTTLCVNNEYQKRVTSFDDNIDWANELLEIWKAQGFKGSPSSPASFFHALFRTPKIPYSINEPFARGFHGGVQQILTDKNIVEPPLYYYDLMQAYFWAGHKLPIDLQLYQPGDKYFLAVFEPQTLPDLIPNCYRNKYFIVDNYDIEFYNLQGHILYGVSWENEEDLITPIFDKLVNMVDDKTLKRIKQSYWGRWAANAPLIMVSVKNNRESVSKLGNLYRNSIWATLIVHRVIRRIWEYVNNQSVLILIDAILTRSRFLTGNIPGAIRLKYQYDNPIKINAPGVWCELPEPASRTAWAKHAGYQ